MYKELLTVEQTPERTAEVLSYNAGDILRCMVKAERFGRSGYLEELRVACADALIMINLLGEQLGYDPLEQRGLGLARFQERMEECRKDR